MTSKPIVQTTKGIKISVQTMYVPEQSNPQANAYVFAYVVNITNESDSPVQLLSRHWDIIDCVGSFRSIEGDGVVGLKPVIQPDGNHSYVSGCHFQTPAGKMEGWYVMENLETGERFKAWIPPFSMFFPGMLN